MVPPYSLGIYPPTTPKTLWSPVAPSSRKNRFSEGIFFWQITQMALESPKIDICQNWPRRVLGDVIRCLESKFDKKIPMGRVPNCRKEIPMCHAIRWFKCKLKPPNKKPFRKSNNSILLRIPLWPRKLDTTRNAVGRQATFLGNKYTSPVQFSLPLWLQHLQLQVFQHRFHGNTGMKMANSTERSTCSQHLPRKIFLSSLTLARKSTLSTPRSF